MNRREFCLLPMAGALASPQAAWVELCDGKTLNGWRQVGKGLWRVEDATIVGRQGPDGGAGELLTEKQWKNFILELEWKMQWPGNSGIWFRHAGPKSAYQADILEQPGAEGALSGSLYCTGRAFIAKNRDRTSINREGWNAMRIRAVGDAITIEQNGKTVVQVRDATVAGPGSVGIQIHRGEAFQNEEIRVRGMRLRPLDR